MQDSKKKYIIMRVLLFFFLLGLFLVALSYVLKNKVLSDEPAVPTAMKSYVNIQKEPENTIELLVMGNSLSYTTVSPKQMEEDFGYNTWLVGQPGQVIQGTWQTMQKVFKKQSPDIVLLETNPMFDRTDGTDSLKITTDIWMRYHFPFLHFHDLWKNFIMKKTYDVDTYHGYEKYTKVVPYTDGPYMKPTEESAEFHNNSTCYVEKMKELCDKKGTRLILYSTPSPLHYSYATHNALTSWCEEQGLEYIDLNLLVDEIGINWEEDYADGGEHLNYIGTSKVTNYLGAYLRQISEEKQ